MRLRLQILIKEANKLFSHSPLPSIFCLALFSRHQPSDMKHEKPDLTSELNKAKQRDVLSHNWAPSTFCDNNGKSVDRGSICTECRDSVERLACAYITFWSSWKMSLKVASDMKALWVFINSDQQQKPEQQPWQWFSNNGRMFPVHTGLTLRAHSRQRSTTLGLL